MDGQDHKLTVSSTGHECQSAHLCHRCGWPFPNPHHGAKQRRTHKRICGTIEGYKIIHSEEHDYHLAVSDDEQSPDEDALTASEKLRICSQCCETVGQFAFAKETYESINASAGIEKVSDSAEDFNSMGAAGDILPEECLLSRPFVKAGGVTLSSEATQRSDAVSSIDVEIRQKSSLIEDETAGNLDANERLKYDTDANENGNLESKDKFPVKKVSAPASANKTLSPEDDPTMKTLKEDVNQIERKSYSKSLDSGKEKGGGASEEVQVILGSTVAFNDLPDFPSSGEADWDTRNVEELSTSKSCSLKPYSEKSFQGINGDKLPEVSHSVGSAEMYAGLNHDIGDVLDNDSLNTTFEDPESQAICELPKNIHVTSNVELESLPIVGTVTELTDNRFGSTTKQQIAKEPTLLGGNFAKSNTCFGESVGAFDATKVSSQPNNECNVAVVTENSESPNPTMLENLIAKKCLNKASPDVEERHSNEYVGIPRSVGAASSIEQTFDGNGTLSDECSVVTQRLKKPAHFKDLHETSATSDDKRVVNVEHGTALRPKSWPDKGDDKLTKMQNGVFAMDLLDNSISKTEALEGSSQSELVVAETNAQSPDLLVTSFQQHRTTTEEAHPDKSDVIEPPSFMTLVQSGGESDQVTAASEIVTMQSNQQTQSDVLQAGWFPSLTNFVNESEGRKKNEEIIAKVTSWGPVKHHSPLKDLSDEVKSPCSKQVPAENQKNVAKPKNNGAVVSTVSLALGPEAPVPSDRDTHKDIDEWNSQASYPVEIKKEKKGKSYWVPFLCCSSVHKEL